MLTRDKIEQLNPEERTRVLKELTAIIYGTPDPLQSTVCYDLDITKPTWRRWRNQNEVPIWVLLLFNEWAHRGEAMRAEFAQWSDILDKLADLTESLRGLAHLRAAATFEYVSGGSATAPESPKSGDK